MGRKELAMAALVAAITVAGPARAFDDIKVDFSLYTIAMAAYDQKSQALADPDDVVGRSDTGLRFKASTLFDNGIQLRFLSSLQLEGASSFLPNRGHLDEAYFEFGSFLGKVQLGRHNGVGEQMRVRTPVPVYRVYTDNTELDPLEIANLYTKLDLSGDNGKVIYLSPRIAGFQVGASYMVEDAKTGYPVHITTNWARGRSGAKQATEAGVNYNGKLGGFSLDAAATYYADNRSAAGQRDPSGYDLGVGLGLNGWMVGGNFTQGNNISHATLYSNTTKSTIWSAGVTYGNGPWLLGGAYSRGADDPSGSSNTVDYQSYVLGMIYQFGPGVSLSLGWQHDDANPDPLGVVAPNGGSSLAPGQAVDGNAVFVETGLKF
jgi:predicted porin